MKNLNSKPGDVWDEEKGWVRPHVRSNDLLIAAFIQGAKFWEYVQTEGTMWQADQKIVLEEAKRRLENNTLGSLGD